MRKHCVAKVVFGLVICASCGFSVSLASPPQSTDNAQCDPATQTVTNGKIAFASDQDGDSEIYVMNSDGSNIQQLTFNTTDDNEPVWSPDGSHILFNSTRNGDIEVYVMNADGANPTSLTPGLRGFNARWSPDGTRIAFTAPTDVRGQNVYVMNADGSDKINLTNDMTFINTAPFWSRDGHQIFFLSDRNYPIGSALGPAVVDLYLMNADGSNPIRLFCVGISVTAINLSPDGTHVVFGLWTLGPAIIVRDLTTSHEDMLMNGIDTGGAYPAWSPDGKRIVFVSDGPSIVTMDANGANQTTLLMLDSSKSLDNPDWQPVIVPACPSATDTP